MYRKFFKRLIDVVVSFAGLLLLSPVMIIAGLLLAINNDGKIFFIQKRPGYKGKPFNIIKFKTMNDRKNSQGELLPDSERLTRTGRIVRSLSLDELPQLWNVLAGNLSLIGPRPLLMEYLPLYSKEEARRHDVLPGITGWAQIHGRNAISWQEKFKYDLYYVENISFLLDLKIVFITILKIVKKEGINSSNTVTMEKFTGSKK